MNRQRQWDTPRVFGSDCGFHFSFGVGQRSVRPHNDACSSLRTIIVPLFSVLSMNRIQQQQQHGIPSESDWFSDLVQNGFRFRLGKCAEGGGWMVDGVVLAHQLRSL